MTTDTHSATSSAAPRGPALVQLTGITKRYGGVHALRGADFEVRAGEVHALVGENGAGKSTLIKILAGAEVHDGGTVLVRGEPLAAGDTTAALAAGIATVYQEPQLFGELTVAENVFIGREARTRGFVDWHTQRRRCVAVLERLGLDPAIADVRVADLPVAEQQLVSIAKAFAHDTSVLILDEPSAALTDREIDTLFGAVRSMRDGGVGVVYISHRLDELPRISDRVTVLRDGVVVACRPAEELTVRATAELMVGHELTQQVGDRTTHGGAVVLELDRLRRRDAFEDVSLSVRAGEIVALYGLVGSGADAIARAVYGIEPAEAGEIRVHGRPRTLRRPRGAVSAGIAMLPGNRKAQGVFATKSIRFNLSVSHLRLLSRLGVWMDHRRERQVSREFVHRIAIKTPSVDALADTLSGGNQQKLVLARQLVERPRILVLQDPTQGVDVGAKEEIHAIMADLADQGSAVLLVSSDLPEAIALADRLLVVREGRIVREFGRGAAQAEVLAVAAGALGEAPASSQERAATSRASEEGGG